MGKQTSLAEKMRDRINKKFGSNAVKTFGEDDPLLQVKNWIELPEFFKLASGGQGFPCGHLTQLIGEPDSGKTTLLMKGLVECQKAGGVTYLVDNENKFDMKRFALMGGVPDQLEVFQGQVLGTDKEGNDIIKPLSLEDSWNFIEEVCKGVAELRSEGDTVPVMIGWDSIAAATPERIAAEKDSGDAHVAVEAKINNKNVRKIKHNLRQADIALVTINHFYTTMPAPGKPPKDIIKGGEELTFMSTLIVKTKKGAKLEREVLGEKQQIGRMTKYEIFKGHFHGRNLYKAVWVVDKGILESKEEYDEYKKTLKGKL